MLVVMNTCYIELTHSPTLSDNAVYFLFLGGESAPSSPQAFDSAVARPILSKGACIRLIAAFKSLSMLTPQFWQSKTREMANG